MADADRQTRVRAFEAARAVEDVEGMAAAALHMAAAHRFGAPAGSTPAYLYEAYQRTSGVQRARLAAALARVWVYAAEATRAVPFAAEAVAEATQAGEPAALADALDAQLAVHWGPDDLIVRSETTQQLENVVAHLLDADARLSSHLWRLTTAMENLDLVSAQRQVRALADLADETGSARVRLFAVSRCGMLALVTDDVEVARSALTDTVRAGAASGEADAEALRHELAARLAVRCDDRASLAAEAAAFEEFGTAQGVRAIVAEAATLWLAAGRPDRARTVLEPIVAPGLHAVPRDVDWLLILCLALEVAAATGAVGLTAAAVDALTPYAGRGVVNAGGVAFLGVVDDYLWQGCTALGRDEAATAWAQRAAAAYTGLGAPWWADRLRSAGPPPASSEQHPPSELVVHLVPGENGLWTVGRSGGTTALRDLKGFHYLRLLLERPGAEVTAVELSAVVAGHRPQPRDAGVGDVLDRQALSAYRRRITELDEELDQARAWADAGHAAALAAEKGMLLDEVAAATGLGGRPRAVAGDAERARIAVRKALAAAVERIADVDPELGRHLRDSVRTGATCHYDPDPARCVRWVLR